MVKNTYEFCFTQNFPKFYNHRTPVDSPSGPFKSEYIVTLKILQEMTPQDIFFCVPVPSYPLWVFFFKAPGISLPAFLSLVLLSTRLFLLPCLTAKQNKVFFFQVVQGFILLNTMKTQGNMFPSERQWYTEMGTGHRIRRVQILTSHLLSVSSVSPSLLIYKIE